MKNSTKFAAIIIGGIAVLGMSAQTVLAASFTSAQVATHNTATNCWEIINGKVYNLTSFISTHSGGQSVIIAQCGKDASAVFANGPHSATTINALNGFMIGDLGTTPTPTPTPPSTLSTTSGPTPLSKEVALPRTHHEREHEIEKHHSHNSSFIREDEDENGDEDDRHELSESSARFSRVSHDENDDD